MRKFFTIAVSVLLVSCLSESGVDPGTSSTFIRYFNGGNDDEAVGMELTPDGGYIILANTRIQKSEAATPAYKIKLIKTDSRGNPMWTKLYPAIPSDPAVVTDDFAGAAMQLLPSGGYVVTGHQITDQTNNTTKILVMTVNDEGTLVDTLKFGTTAQSKGQGIALASNGNFLVLSTAGTEKMHLDEIDASNPTTLTPIVSTIVEYEAGSTTLARKLLVDESGKAIWSGQATKNGLTGIRMIRTIPNSANVDFDLLYANPPFTETGRDFCKYGQQYAIIGTTDKKEGLTSATDSDIFFVRVSESGEVLSTKSFTFDDPTTTGSNEDQQNDIGNSISSTIDGGAILLSTVRTENLPNGRGETDLYLIKINAFGDKEWASSFGSKFVDEGIVVRQATDGGYVTLGTSSQGSLKLISLIKTDKNGNID